MMLQQLLPVLCVSSPLLNSSLPDGFCAGQIPVNVNQTRTILSLTSTRFITLERSNRSVVLISSPCSSFSLDCDDCSSSSENTTTTINDANNNTDIFTSASSNANATSAATCSNNNDHQNWTKRQLVYQEKLNHGLALHDNYIYASSDKNVFRWSYSGGTNFTTIGPMEEIIYNISSNGTGWTPFGHLTRTLVFDTIGRLYVSVGSMDNVDSDSYRSRIRRFSVEPPYPIDFHTGEVFADGIRNAVGLAFDNNGVLWGVENGASDLYRDDLGGDLNVDNPADELHIYPEENVGSHFGYPYCFTEFLFPHGYGLGRGTGWAWPTFLGNGTVTDDQCRTKYMEATMALQGHSAPLGITFYRWTEPSNRPIQCKNIIPFPKRMDGYAFIAFHGSSFGSRTVATGHSVVYLPMPLTDEIKANGPIDLLTHNSTTARWEDLFRPMDVDFDECGRLLLSSDGAKNNSYAGSKIVRIEYYHVDADVDEDDDNSTNTSSAPAKEVYRCKFVVSFVVTIIFSLLHILLPQ